MTDAQRFWEGGRAKHPVNALGNLIPAWSDLSATDQAFVEAGVAELRKDFKESLNLIMKAVEGQAARAACGGRV